MKPLYAHRKMDALDQGLLPFESQAFIVVPLDVPYLRNLKRERRKLFMQAANEGWTRRKYEAAVLLQYEARGWWQPGTRIGKGDAFRMLKSYEAEWREDADPNDPYLLKQRRKHHGHSEALNRDKVLKDKRRYRETHKEQIAQYRRTHRTQIAEARRKSKQFKHKLG